MATEIGLNTTALAPVGEGLRALFLSAPPAAPPAAPAPKADEAPAQSLDQAVQELAEHVAQSGAELNFRIDEDSGRVVVSIIDARDGTVLRQMPSEEALRIARALTKYESCLIEAQA
jgi:flagellar protein FlaG